MLSDSHSNGSCRTIHGILKGKHPHQCVADLELFWMFTSLNSVNFHPVLFVVLIRYLLHYKLVVLLVAQVLMIAGYY